MDSSPVKWSRVKSSQVMPRRGHFQSIQPDLGNLFLFFFFLLLLLFCSKRKWRANFITAINMLRELEAATLREKLPITLAMYLIGIRLYAPE